MFSIDAGVLQKCVRFARSAVARKSTMPILTAVHVVEGLKSVSFTGTDLDIHATATGPVDGSAGSAGWCVSADALANVAGALSGDVVMDARDSVLHITAGRSKFKLSLPVDEYPKTPDVPADVGSVDGDAALALVAAMRGVRYAASEDETRYVLNGVLVVSDTIVATDGHRMAFGRADVAVPGAVIVPNRAVDVLSGMGGLSRVAFAPGRIVAGGSVDGVSMTVMARLIDGKFPDYKQVIPKDAGGTTITVQRKALLDSLKRVRVVGGDGAVIINASGAELAVSHSSADHGEASDALECSVKGDAIRAGYNGGYLVDALAAAGGDVVELHMADALTPVIVRAGGVITGLVMPMRI